MSKQTLWDKMEPSERRVVIAKDALGQITSNRYMIVPGEGGYLRGIGTKTANRKIHETFNNRKKSDAVTPEDIVVIQNNCRMCARGALLLSKVRKFNSCELGEIGLTKFAGIMAIDAASDDTERGLEGAFTAHDLETIEGSFELWGDNLGVEFGNDFDDPYDRLIAILQNIIDHNGTFNPKVRCGTRS